MRLVTRLGSLSERLEVRVCLRLSALSEFPSTSEDQIPHHPTETPPNRLDKESTDRVFTVAHVNVVGNGVHLDVSLIRLER